jgi:serine/threonine protein kinase
MEHSQIPDLSTVASPPRRTVTYDELDTDGDVVGQGGQAVVYEATVDGSQVAVKEPLGGNTLDTARVEEFLSRAETWELVDRREREQPRWDDSEHIVGVVDIGDELPWIAMEYMNGGSLADRLVDGGLPIDEALWVAESVCRAIEVAHTYGIAHLDIKPANVLFRETPNDQWDVPKVADWGLARLLAKQSGSMEARSVTYGAPEQFEPDEFGEPDTLTDLYQIGALTYALLTGEPPYSGANFSVISDIITPDRPKPPSSERDELGPEIDTAVLTALEPAKRDRYDSVQAFKQALRALRTGGRLPPIVSRRLAEQGQSTGPAHTKPAPTTRETSDPADDVETTAPEADDNAVLNTVASLTGGGLDTTTGAEIAEQFATGRQKIHEMLDNLQTSGDIEYVSGRGYRLTERMRNRDHLGTSDDTDEVGTDSPETKHEQPEPPDWREVLSELESLTDERSQTVSAVVLAAQFAAGREAIHHTLDELKRLNKVEYVSGRGYRPKN